MKPHLQTLAKLLTQNDLKGLLKHYMDCDESENMSQLAFVFNQSQKNPPAFEFYQQLATKFLESKGLPDPLMERINNADTLSFFTPALQLNWHFNRTNQVKRNVLHYLLAGKTATEHPPFNYLRSMMLFESNESLHDALAQRDQHDLTPIEVYLSANQCLAPLPDHEFTALLGLIEIESKKQAVEPNNLKPIVNTVKRLCQNQSVVFNSDLHRLQFIAAYYNQPLGGILV